MLHCRLHGGGPTGDDETRGRDASGELLEDPTAFAAITHPRPRRPEMLRRVACFALAASVIGACALPTDTGEDTGSASQAYMQYNMGFYNPFLNKCLDAYAWETSEFPRVAMWDCNGLGNQLWTYNTDTHEITDWNGNCLENWYFDNYSVGLHSCWG